MTQPPAGRGIRIAGTGSSTPDNTLSNFDLEKILDTSDEWIQQRTGIKTRRVVDQSTGAGTISLACESLANAVEDSGIDPKELDLVICASVTQEMTCPSASCRAAHHVGATNAAAFDLGAACSGFLYGLNLADTLIRQGRYKTIAVIGSDAMSTVLDYTERGVSILFGDASGAAIVTADDDPSRGCLYQSMGADASNWQCLYLPKREVDIPEADRDNPIEMGKLRMNGREVFKFAVKKFQEVIEDALENSGVDIDDISQLICHQSNLRIIESAREKLGLEKDRVYVNIDRIGNSSAGSIPLCLDELNKAGRIREGENVLFVAFGGGLTWASSLWRV
ncbi:MAG: ketoacyl-ACP synthase III [Phycisphaerales bacterium]|nr:ketoacyl-ACP synthase III [Phycisphaerales bacterium]